MSELDEGAGDSFVDPSILVGVWANATRVNRGRDEVAIDFLRRIPGVSDRFLVGRLLVPPLVAVELRDQLDEAWQGYTGWPTDEV